VLRAHVQYHLIETQTDWTEARYDEYITLYTAPAGKAISEITSADYLNYNYTDYSHSPLTISFNSQTLASKFISNGDTSGNDVGNCTDDDAYLSVYWNPITVQLRTL